MDTPRPHSKSGFDTAIASLYKAAAGVASWSSALERLSELINADKVLIWTHDSALAVGSIDYSFNVDAHFVETYGEHYASGNPWISRSNFFQAPKLVWAGENIVPLSELEQTSFYDLFLAPQAIWQTLHAVLRVNGTQSTVLVASRRPNSDAFGQQEIDLCRMYSEHVDHAIDTFEALNSRTVVNLGLRETLENERRGVAIYERQKGFIFANETFIGISKDNADANWQPAKVHTSMNALNIPTACQMPARILERLDDCISEEAETVAVEVARGADHPLLYHLFPFTYGGHFRCGPEEAVAIVVSDPKAELELSVDSIRNGYGLTLSEARVSALIGSGLRIEDAASSLGITPNTARTHLKRIFEKTGTGRQAELLRLLLRSARVTKRSSMSRSGFTRTELALEKAKAEKKRVISLKKTDRFD